MASRFLFLLTRISRRRSRRLILMTLLILLTLLVFFILVPLPYIIYKPPASLIRFFQYLWPDVLWHTTTTEKIVALTIDDAPSSHTEEILALLKEYNATATFFVIGSQASGRENILTKVVQAGCELGNHAWRDEPSLNLESQMLVDQIHSVEKIIETAYQHTDNGIEMPRYFRPGSGVFNKKMRGMLRKLGYKMVLGSVYPHDAQIKYPNLNAKHISSMVKPGSVIICHDRRSWTVPMLKVVLPELIHKRGYKVVTVTGLLKATGQGKMASMYMRPVPGIR